MSLAAATDLEVGEIEATLKTVDENGTADGYVHVYDEEGAWCMALGYEELRTALSFSGEDDSFRVYSEGNNDWYTIKTDDALVVLAELCPVRLSVVDGDGDDDGRIHFYVAGAPSPDGVMAFDIWHMALGIQEMDATIDAQVGMDCDNDAAIIVFDGLGGEKFLVTLKQINEVASEMDASNKAFANDNDVFDGDVGPAIVAALLAEDLLSDG